jgi:CRP/FNR family transcriptional regulator, cyclic AMP receptor protein
VPGGTSIEAQSSSRRTGVERRRRSSGHRFTIEEGTMRPGPFVHRPSDPLDQVAQVALFADSTKRERRAAEPLGSLVDVPRGRILCDEGDVGREFFVILDGRLRVTVGGAPVALLGPGDSFGEIALLSTRGRRLATVTTTSEARVVVYNRAEFSALLHACPAVARHLARDATTRAVAAGEALRYRPVAVPRAVGFG